MEYWEDYEVLEIETPELLTLHLPLAGFGPRALAFFLDSLIVGVAQTVLVIIMIIVGSGLAIIQSLGSNTGLMLALAILALIVVLLVYPMYFIYFESRWNGQTPGKRMTGIRVVMRGGLPLNGQAVVVRNLMRLVDMLPSSHFTGLISFFASRSQQRVGDLVADTVVVREFTAQQPMSWVQAYGTVPAKIETGTVTPRLALAIHNYLSRAPGFDLYLRQQLSGDLVRALGYSADTLSLQQRDNYLASVLSGYHSRS